MNERSEIAQRSTEERTYTRDLGVESAFARNGVVLPNDQVDYGDVGLTKRELFAAMAMQGICGDGIPGSHHRPDETARDAVAYADALLKELAK